MNIKTAPVIIVGTGIAGLLTSLKLSRAGIASIIVTKTTMRENSSWMAQGGIAAVLPENPADSVETHVHDTLVAGAGLTDEAVTRSILEEGHLAIQDLIDIGVPFDRVGGKLAFTKEGAHTCQRILHAGGDATGRSIQHTLIESALSDPNITILPESIALSLVIEDDRCLGVKIVGYEERPDLNPLLLLGNYTILATGGIGQLYSQTTNPTIATGDGAALAYLAGAKVQDMEFVQFHPTAFWSEGSVRFLISEALRGEGGILRDKNGRAFARDYHPDGELAPRDVVTRAISSQIQQDGRPHVDLDITHLPAKTIELRFPNILTWCLEYGIDIRRDFIPVAPAAHYGMGGVWVDVNGKTTINKLLAVGEVVSSGLHGANRLASNSLLECVVLARRVAAQVASSQSPIPEQSPSVTFKPLAWGAPPELGDAVNRLRETMWQDVGILRNREGLAHALTVIDSLEREAEREGWLHCVPNGVEFRNMLVTSRLIAEAALARCESRGAHYRTDCPNTDTVAVHSIQQREPAVPVRGAL